MRYLKSLSAAFILSLGACLQAQSPDASLTGMVTDQSNALIIGANLRAKNIDTGTEYDTKTGVAGIYSLLALSPGRYQLTVEKTGFRRLVESIMLHVQDELKLDIKMEVGPVSETIRVQADAPLKSSESAAVSTLVDNRLVENLPLNGRSFSSLLDLTPGVVQTPTAAFYEQGQFSVNGQRPDANYFMVDGVSANLGTPGASFGQGGLGQLPATNALGGMSNLVSLDALQEFRVQTSTFAPELGRSPGAQISVLTKSGTNKLSGKLFEYLRNDAFDANDWFADNKGLPKAALRQNDFGGVLGGPLRHDRLFFFGSFEKVQVRQPQIANTFEPSLATRRNAPISVQPLLNSFPKPNGADLGDGTAAFVAGYSDPSSLDAYSARVDYVDANGNGLFVRYSDAPSKLTQRAGLSFNYNTLLHTEDRTQTVTLGATGAFGPQMTNEFRFNRSVSQGNNFLTLDNFGGGTPLSDLELFPGGTSSNSSLFTFQVGLVPFGLSFDRGLIANNLQHQINVTDNLSWVLKKHQTKVGFDIRRLQPEQKTNVYQQAYYFDTLADVLANSATQVSVNSRTPDVRLVAYNSSLFAQDTWKLGDVTLTYGLRWEYNTAPSSPNGTPPLTVTQVNDLATTALAPRGTALWHPKYDNMAPRFGLAWSANSRQVMRAGAGVFYDLGYSEVSNAMMSFPYVQQKVVLGASFPLTGKDADPPPFTTSPPVPSLSVVDPQHVLPITYEWNVAADQSFSNNDVLSLTYVGAAGRKLMRRDIYYAPNPDFTYRFDVQRNAGSSSYNALQAQYRHRLSQGIQALLSFTWGHSLDDVSSDGNIANVPLAGSRRASERGASDYDVRSSFSGAVSYDIPEPEKRELRPILGSWSMDSILYVRSAPPLTVVTGNNPYPYVSLSGSNSVQRPNVVPGVPLYVHQALAPGGKVINAAAFRTPSPASSQGNLGRNSIRGFGATQWDVTFRKRFRFREHLIMQGRADFFNVLNHPNFGPPTNYLSSPLFGKSTRMLNNSLGGLSPLYQIGGPRSTQIALELIF